MIPAADLGLLEGFERALLNRRLRLVYQPKVALSDGTLKRVEALVRWAVLKRMEDAPSALNAPAPVMVSISTALPVASTNWTFRKVLPSKFESPFWAKAR